MLKGGNNHLMLNRKLIEDKPPHVWQVFHVNWVSHSVVWKHNRGKRLFHALIYRHYLFIQFTEVTRGGHLTYDHIWEEPSLWLYKQTTHVDNPKIVEDKNSFLISCSVWSYTVMPCSKNIPAVCPGGLCEWLQLMCSERLKRFCATYWCLSIPFIKWIYEIKIHLKVEEKVYYSTCTFV